MKSKLGLIVLGHFSLDPLVFTYKPAAKSSAIAQLEKMGIEIIAADDIPVTKKEVLSAVDKFRKEDVDGVIVYQVDYSNEELGCILGMELTECPMFIWSGWGSDKTPTALAALSTLAGNLRRLDKDFFYTVGEIDEKEVQKNILAFAKATHTAKKLRRANVGIVGLSNPGMLDTTFSSFHLRKIVPNLLNLDTYELVKLHENVKIEEINEVAKTLKNKVGKINVKDEQITNAIKTYFAIKAMANKHQLDAITIREWPELAERGISICIAAALLNDEGIVCFQESVADATITALAMHYLTGNVTYLGDVATADPTNNILTFVHEGAAAFSLAQKKEDITLVDGMSVGLYARKQAGVNVQFTLKPGKVTLAKLSGRPINDKLSMLITSGEIISGTNVPVKGSSNCYLKLDAPVKDLVDAWMKYGCEHHKVLVYEDIKSEMNYLSDILKLEKIVL